MPVLTDYQPTVISNRPSYETVVSDIIEQKPIIESYTEWRGTNIGLTFQFPEPTNPISEILKLQDNWDNDGAIAPTASVKLETISIVSMLNRIGQEINGISPGFDGEIAINLTNENRIFEILIYPDKSKYIIFDKSTNEAEQGAYIENTLFEKLNWLNQKLNVA